MPLLHEYDVRSGAGRLPSVRKNPALIEPCLTLRDAMLREAARAPRPHARRAEVLSPTKVEQHVNVGSELMDVHREAGEAVVAHGTYNARGEWALRVARLHVFGSNPWEALLCVWF